MTTSKGVMRPLAAIAATTALAGGTAGTAWACGGGGIGVASGFGNLISVISWAFATGFTVAGFVTLIKHFKTPGKAPLNVAWKRFGIGGAFLAFPFIESATGYNDPSAAMSWTLGGALGFFAVPRFAQYLKAPEKKSLKPGLTPAGFSAFFLLLPLFETAAGLSGLIPFAAFSVGGAFLSFVGLSGLREYYRTPTLMPLRPCLVRVTCGVALLALFAVSPLPRAVSPRAAADNMNGAVTFQQSEADQFR